MLIIEDLTHVYDGRVRALDAVSLTIPKGMYGLLGPNGAGKSTLMRIIATLQAPTSGFVRFGEIDVLKDPDALRRRLGYLPQDFGVYPRVSAIDMLDHLAILKGLGDRPTRKGDGRGTCFARSICGTTAGKLWRVFSGGMRQRFGIAQALIGDPS